MKQEKHRSPVDKEAQRSRADILTELSRVTSKLRRREARDEAFRRGGEAGSRQFSHRLRQRNRESKYVSPYIDIN